MINNCANSRFRFINNLFIILTLLLLPDSVIGSGFGTPAKPQISTKIQSQYNPTILDQSNIDFTKNQPDNVATSEIQQPALTRQCTGGSLIFPLPTLDTITANYHCFNQKTCPSYKSGNSGYSGNPHPGLDLLTDTAPGATPVYAAARGNVVIAPPKVKSAVVIKSTDINGKTIYILYTHMANKTGTDLYGGKYGYDEKGVWKKLRNFQPNEFVEAGEQIGRVGNFGGDPVHLHFSITLEEKKGDLDTTGFDSPNNTTDPTPFLWAQRLNFDSFTSTEKANYGGTGFDCLQPPTPPCPPPDDNLINFYKYPEKSCGNEGDKAVFKYDPKSMYNNLSPVNITVPFKPGSVFFPKRQIDPNEPIKTNRSYTFRPSHINPSSQGDLVLDLSGADTKAGGAVVQWDWNNGNNQKWGFDLISPGYYQIINLNSGLCLSDGPAGSQVTQQSCQDDARFEWKVDPVQNRSGDYVIVNKASGLVLDVNGASTSRGAKIVLWYRNDQNNQIWHLCELTQLSLTANNTGLSSFTIKEDVTDLNSAQYINKLVNGPNKFSLAANSICQTVSSTFSMASQTCENHAPNPPSLSHPDNKFSQANYPPWLFWTSGGDPDNNPLSFQVELIGPTASYTSGWLNGTDWYPSELDKKFGEYQWHVRARDQDLATSSWSDLRTFRVDSPNKPPSISFNTANGNASDTILSREANWTFTGTASDPENDLRQIAFHCAGEGCGTQTAHSDGANWSHTQGGMLGENDIYFMAYDGFGNNTSSRHVKLLIDQAPPVTQIGLNGESNPAMWPAWFTAPVQVSLTAQDGASGAGGKARAGVDRVYYRVDGGAWQSVQGEKVETAVNSDGAHTVETYSVDKLGNTEAVHSASFHIDQTPPSPPARRGGSQRRAERGLAKWQ